MMQAKAMMLMHRRAVLIARIETERAALAQHGTALRPAAQVIDKVRAGVRYIKSHPGILLLPLTLLVLWRPRRLLTFVISGVSAWRFVQRTRHRLLASS